MSNLVDEEAKKIAMNKWIEATAYLEKPQFINFALLLAAFNASLEAYEAAKRCKRNSYVDDREPTIKENLTVEPMPALPEKSAVIGCNENERVRMRAMNRLIDCVADLQRRIK